MHCRGFICSQCCGKGLRVGGVGRGGVRVGKTFFFFPFNPDIKDSLNVLGGFALTADVHSRRPKKTSARWEKFALHRTEEKLNIAGVFFFFGENVRFREKDFLL